MFKKLVLTNLFVLYTKKTTKLIRNIRFTVEILTILFGGEVAIELQKPGIRNGEARLIFFSAPSSEGSGKVFSTAEVTYEV